MEVGLLPPAWQPLCLVTTPAQMVAFQPLGYATTILHTASQISSRISDFPKKLSFWGMGGGCVLPSNRLAGTMLELLQHVVAVALCEGERRSDAASHRVVEPLGATKRNFAEG